MKILAVCGNGLGSSFMLSINVNKVLKKMQLDAQCKNIDLASAKTEKADFYIGSPEIMSQLEDGKRNIIKVINIANLVELEIAIKNKL